MPDQRLFFVFQRVSVDRFHHLVERRVADEFRHVIVARTLADEFLRVLGGFEQTDLHVPTAGAEGYKPTCERYPRPPLGRLRLWVRVKPLALEANVWAIKQPRQRPSTRSSTTSTAACG